MQAQLELTARASSDASRASPASSRHRQVNADGAPKMAHMVGQRGRTLYGERAGPQSGADTVNGAHGTPRDGQQRTGFFADGSAQGMLRSGSTSATQAWQAPPPTWRAGGAVHEPQAAGFLYHRLDADSWSDHRATDRSYRRGFCVPANAGELSRADPYWTDTVPAGGGNDLAPFLRPDGGALLEKRWHGGTTPSEHAPWLSARDALQGCSVDECGRLVRRDSHGRQLWRCLGASAALHPRCACARGCVAGS